VIIYIEQTENVSLTKLLKGTNSGEIVSACNCQTKVFVNVHFNNYSYTLRFDTIPMSTTAACNITNEHRSFCRRVL